MSGNEFDIANSGSKSYTESKILALRENINLILEFTKNIETFLQKQYELFEVLNSKFPKIEQFSNALQDAVSLNQTIESMQGKATLCLDDLEALEEIIEVNTRQLQNGTEVREILSKLFIRVDDIMQNPDVLIELKELLSKID